MLGSLIASAVLLVAFVVVEMRVREPMFDLSLLQVPTFDGGLVAAWAISASLFSLLTYLVIYMQSLLGYSGGRRGHQGPTVLTGIAISVVAGIAGRARPPGPDQVSNLRARLRRCLPSACC